MSPARTSAYLAGVALSAAEGQASRQGAPPVGKRSAGCPWWRTSRLELLCCMKAVGRDWAELRSEACDAVGYAVDLPLCSAWYRSARLEPCAVAGMLVVLKLDMDARINSSGCDGQPQWMRTGGVGAAPVRRVWLRRRVSHQRTPRVVL